jgi:hypothetical protein
LEKKGREGKRGKELTLPPNWVTGFAGSLVLLGLDKYAKE